MGVVKISDDCTISLVRRCFSGKRYLICKCLAKAVRGIHMIDPLLTIAVCSTVADSLNFFRVGGVKAL